MQKLAKLAAIPRIIGMLFLLHALMLLGADEISTIENGGIRTIRSLGRILTLYRADPAPFLEVLPGWLSAAFGRVLSMPGWGVFAVIGGVLAALFRARD